MSHSTARLLLSMLTIAGAVVVYLAVIIAMDRLPRSSRFLGPVVAGAAAGLFIGGSWALIWRKTIRWTGKRVLLSVASMIGAAAIGVLVAFALSKIPFDLNLVLASASSAVAWPAFLVLIWREARGERIRRLAQAVVPCPECGYNLAGLRHTSCPECGATFRIEQLLGARLAGEQADI